MSFEHRLFISIFISCLLIFWCVLERGRLINIPGNILKRLKKNVSKMKDKSQRKERSIENDLAGREEIKEEVPEIVTE